MIVGITGHQNIGTQEQIEWTNHRLDELVLNNSIDLGVTCLARGADQLYAEVLSKHNISYLAIIASKNYESTFIDKDSVEKYKALKSKAKEVITLDYDKASEQAYYDAGKMLVDRSDFIIAVWDGEQSKGLGGTADVVKYALNLQKRVIHINTLINTVSNLD